VLSWYFPSRAWLDAPVTRSGRREHVCLGARVREELPAEVSTVGLALARILSMVAQGEPLGVTHMGPVRRRDRVPRIQVGSSLLSSAGRASAARRGLLLGGLRSEARAGDLHEVGTVGQPVEGGGSEQRFAEQLRPLRSVSVARQNN
jgi:hypothetical protein